jgi:hypothetical protein
LLKHGIDGNEVEIVEDSWTAKPGDRSSRSMRFRCPPDFGVCAAAGVTPRPTRVARARTGTKSMRRERVIVFLPVAKTPGRSRVKPESESIENIRQRSDSDNCDRPARDAFPPEAGGPALVGPAGS